MGFGEAWIPAITASMDWPDLSELFFREWARFGCYVGPNNASWGRARFEGTDMIEHFWMYFGDEILSGFLLLLLLVIFYLLSGGKIRPGKQKICDEWTVLIPDAADRVDIVFSRLRDLIFKRKLPNSHPDTVRTRDLRQTVLRGGEKRRFLIVFPPSTHEVKLYRIYVGVRSYGQELQVCWYLMLEPGLFRRILARLLSFAGAIFNPRVIIDPFWLWERRSLFGSQDLSAHASIIHDCAKTVVNETMVELGQDPAKVNTRTKGILDLW